MHLIGQKVHVGQNLKNFIQMANSKDFLWMLCYLWSEEKFFGGLVFT